MQTELKPEATPGAETDFDFMFGRWTVRHRRLKQRLAGCQDWEGFSGTSQTAPILSGYGNVEDNQVHLPGNPYRALALRSYDAQRGTWAIWWLDGRAPHVMDVPVTGRFEGDTGSFYADDVIEGQAVKVRFLWRKGAVPRWEQAFSIDGGADWETNWIMEFTRADG